ncbi:MAG: dTDP-4-amino-4,6-dideoxygalactose transaminase [Muribaculum sp.]|nr:dTDP-4-amino-4,6-dideoxygalactose transaminase [Muribaculaceae bacterium]MCM1081259.1 dTDP-4-amino-4,6-dideoxygalactose transaminase [Muribaculum sp.]
MIPFNKPFLTGKENEYICEAVSSGKLSGNGVFTKKCQEFFESEYGFQKALLTTSCSDALEMAAILSGVGPSDEVIVPSYTFVSSALAFVRQGCRIVFADSCGDNPNIDADKLESLVTERTRVIVPVHYAGVACDMDKIMDIANRHNLIVVEDAAQAIDSYYKGRPLGSIGHMGCFSFHETKNIIAGEGGMLTINDPRFFRRSEIIWEKGTNRSEFFRGEVNKYGWVDTGSSFLPSELVAAFLWAQIENMPAIQARRKQLWLQYHDGLAHLAAEGKATLPDIPAYATNNAHMFYMVCRSIEERTALIAHLKSSGVLAVFHYLSLHRSAFYTSHPEYRPERLTEIAKEGDEAVVVGLDLPNCDHFADCLLRLPMFYELADEEVLYIICKINEFYAGR